MRPPNWLLASRSEERETFPAPTKRLPSKLRDQDLDFIERELREALRREDDRERGVQARLTALLGLSSLVTAVLSGAAVFAATVEIQLAPLLLGMVLASWAYLSLQSIAAMLFTLHGLMPRDFWILSPWDKVNKRSSWNRRRRMSQHIRRMRKTNWSTNRRMEDMMLALGSLRRFAWGSLVLLVMLLIVVLDQRYAFLQDVLETIRRLSEG